MRLEPAASLEELRDDWTRIETANVFSTYEWAETWWHHFGGGKPLRAARVRDGDGRAVAILPLYLSRARPLRVLRFVGHGPADELGPVAAPGDGDAAWAGLGDALDASGWDVFVGDQLPAPAPWRGVAAPIARQASPVLRFETRDWDEYLRSRSSNFRQLVRRRERNLASQRKARFRLAAADSLERDLDVLFALHRERWPAGTSFARSEPFHRDFARAALARAWLRLWLLEIDGEPAAAWYGFRFGGAEWFYQSGRSPRFERHSIGLVLLAHTVREAQLDGLAEYRFLRGDEPYKFRFTATDPGLVTVARARTPLGYAALAGARGARASLTLVRRLRARA